MKLKCKNCSAEFSRYPSQARGGFCTKKCADTARVGVPLKQAIKEAMSKNHRTKNGYTSAFKGKIHTPQRNQLLSEIHSGNRNPNWQGGIYPENLRARRTAEYRNWKMAVLERDGHKCIECGAIEHLQVDHIKPFALFPELRTILDNGRTLCADCHRKTETWGSVRSSNFISGKYTFV